MKAIIVILSIFTFGFASNGMNNDYDHNAEIQTVIHNPIKTDDRKDCTVRLDVELSDGTTIQGELTFEDVTWWQCTKMQLVAWWKRNF